MVPTSSTQNRHIPVMLMESLENLKIKKNGVYVDGTLGLGGHSEIILQQIDSGLLIGIDRDKDSEACEFVSSITGDNSREVVSFGTEAGLFQEIGISTAVCGPGSIEQAHKIDEFIKLDEIHKCLNFLDGVKDKSSSK